MDRGRPGPLPEVGQLEAFLAVASTLHFVAAAQQLHVTQSTISHRIRMLEQTVGVELFDRSRRRVSLTPAGHAYRRRVEPLLTELHAAAHDADAARSGEIGRLVVACSGTPSTSPLIDAVAELARSAPRLRIELRSAGLKEQVELLHSGGVDLGYTFLPLPDPLDGIASHDLSPAQLFAWMARDHRLADAEAVELDDLRTERWVLLSERAEPGFASFARHLWHGSPASPIEVDSLDACASLERGIGVTIMCASDLVPAGVRPVPLAGPARAPQHALWSAHARNPALPPLLALLGASPD